MAKKFVTHILVNLAAITMIFNTINQSNALSVILFSCGLGIILYQVSDWIGCPTYTKHIADIYQDIHLYQ